MGFIILNVSTECGQETILVLIASLSIITGSWGNKPKCTDSRSICCGQWIQMVTIVIQNRKYLSYDNPIDWGESTRDIEVATLKRALQIGHVLNRIVILPAFTCRGCVGGACKTPTNKCSLNTHLRISVFDGKFSGLYREHLFLSNPKVPKSIKASVSPVIAIGSVNEMPIENTKISKVKTKSFKPKDSDNGASVDEFLQWFGDGTDLSKYSVLKFSSLYNSIQTLDSSNPNYKTIMGKIKNGFKKAIYRQY